MVLPDGERREYLKPIMFSGGIGQMDDQHNEKGKPELGMLVVKLGGPAYRIGGLSIYISLSLSLSLSLSR